MDTIRFREAIRYLFEPASVAVVGASDKPDKLGYHVMKSLTEGGFKGEIMPLNPGSRRIFGIPCYPNLSALRVVPDLAIIVVPATKVPSVLEECGLKGVKASVLITAGFSEIDDPAGALMQKELAETAHRFSLPVIGPNTFGLVNLSRSLNASFTPEFSLINDGGVTLLSQSGGISHLLGFQAMREGVGMGKIVGLGNRLNIDFSDLLPYLEEDPYTKSVALYLEGLDNPRKLLEHLMHFTKRKPVVAYKAGSGSKGNLASKSHTGSLAGRSEIYEAALRQAGAHVTRSPQALLDAAKVLALCPRLKNNSVAVLTGQAGPGMVAAEVCEAKGLEIATFTPDTQFKINRLLPPLAMRSNPVDMGPAWYDKAAIKGIIQTAMEDESVGGALILMMFASANREAVPFMKDFLLSWGQRKPVVTCLSSPKGIWDEDISHLEKLGAIVNFPTPERAAAAMAVLRV